MDGDFVFDMLNNTEKVKVLEMTINYTSMTNPKKTDLPCFNKKTYFNNLMNRKVEDNSLIQDGLEPHILLCLLICCYADLDITIDFKPYIHSKIEIKGKKEFHYFLYCMDYDNKDKKIDYSKMNIDIKENQPLALPSAAGDNIANGGGNDCTINCPVCGTVNVLNETNTEFKCQFCESSLF